MYTILWHHVTWRHTLQSSEPHLMLGHAYLLFWSCSTRKNRWWIWGCGIHSSVYESVYDWFDVVALIHQFIDQSAPYSPFFALELYTCLCILQCIMIHVLLFKVWNRQRSFKIYLSTCQAWMECSTVSIGCTREKRSNLPLWHFCFSLSELRDTLIRSDNILCTRNLILWAMNLPLWQFL
jgi:hypothetical protein